MSSNLKNISFLLQNWTSLSSKEKYLTLYRGVVKRNRLYTKYPLLSTKKSVNGLDRHVQNCQFFKKFIGFGCFAYYKLILLMLLFLLHIGFVANSGWSFPKITSLFVADSSYNNPNNLNNTNKETHITDREGNTYKIVKIGDQWWMAENLRACSCTDNTAIQTLKIGMSNEQSPAIYWYENDSESKYSQLYGPLYNYMAMRTCNLCPKGWHIPDKVEWFQLCEDWASFPPEKQTPTSGNQDCPGFHLRATRNDLWPNNELATNSAGFNALPSGLIINGNWHLRYFHNRASWWTSSTDENSPYLAQVGNGKDGFWVALYYFSYATSIRCVKDKE